MNSFLKLSDFLPISSALGFLLRFVGDRELAILAAMCRRRKPTSKVQSVENAHDGLSLLDLPDLAIDTVLSKLPPHTLCKVACVSKELYKRCGSDHLWLPHVTSKWGSAAGPLAYKEWQTCHVNPCKSDDLILCKPLGWPLSCLWTPWAKSPLCDNVNDIQSGNAYMRWYTTLETGAFWFPAQVYNREHGHVGFLLSCYDAEVCYDRQTDTFTARYPPHGSCSLLVEEGVSWQRLRAPPVPTTAHELYISESLNELHPGDHVEVQWRRNKRLVGKQTKSPRLFFFTGWWYGLVGHLDTCDRDGRHCCCHLDDLIWLEFNQYAPGSRWRRTAINRKSHQETGSEAEGFYAGIRKLRSKEEISAWRELWPRETLE